MRRHHVFPALLLALALLAMGTAVVLDEPREVGAAEPSPSGVDPPASTTTAVATPQDDLGPFAPLVDALEGVWAQTRQPGSSCLMVLDGDRVVFERHPDLRLTPASAMKLLTAAAVLHELDPNERLVTRAVTAAPWTDGVIDGDLYLVGGGDPVLGTADWASHFERQPRLHTTFEALADRLAAAGVREVRGRVVGDEGRYDDVRYVPSWPTRYHNDNETGPLGALFVNDGFAVWDRRDGEDIPWDEPARDAAAVLTTLLRQRGVTVAGEAAAGRGPDGATELAALESPTIGELVSAMLLDSDNGTAELLVKELGLRTRGAGTTAAGTEAVMASLAAQGLPVPGAAVADGSGLDRGNAVTCRLLTSVLARTVDDDAVQRGLPIAAQTGTLHERFLATEVAGRLRAKTGSISGVAALAGLADGNHGRLTFAHVLNGIGSYADARRIQDALGLALVGA